MFAIADSDDDGTVSFREFLDIMVLFTKGSPEDKARIMFNMYDLDKSGELSIDEFKIMLKSMMDIGNTTIDPAELSRLVNGIIESSGLGRKQSLTLQDFLVIMSNHKKELSQASLADQSEILQGELQGKKKGNKAAKAKNTKFTRAMVSVKRGFSEKQPTRDPNRHPTARRIDTSKVTMEQEKPKKASGVVRLWNSAVKLNQYYGRHIICVSIYVCITLGVFANAFWRVVSNNASGLQRIAGLAVAFARASGGALAFNYSTLLLTMSRNTITLLRETFLHRYIPFDSAITMHRIVAWMAMFFTVMHVVAHGINFYVVSTQSPADLMCIFPEYWFPSDFLPDFAFWVFRTITGVTGVVLCLILIVMYVFATDYSRRLIHKWFRRTHYTGYVLVYIFCVLHGSGILIQIPSFYLYFLGFAVLYTMDKLYSLSRRRVKIAVVRAELLPSNVTHLEFQRPTNFSYKAGQWVKIACLAQSENEYHPFTLSSAPHEETLSLHIRAVGPWTTNLRGIYDPKILRDSPLPKIYLDGPFGEGHQDWYKYKVAVLVGGGIGVTPFASIIKDLVNTFQTQAKSQIQCEAVYFIWVTRDQKQYEWLTDIIQEVESKDEKRLLQTHIFITQLPHKFDLRTTMLYICEKHFQKISGKSLFTGLRATTHFGRPDFLTFFNLLAEEHSAVETFGVFSCGPPPMTKGVDKACSKLNGYEGAIFSHHFENF